VTLVFQYFDDGRQTAGAASSRPDLSYQPALRLSFGDRLMYDRSKGVNSGSATAGFNLMVKGFASTEGNTILTNIKAQIA
jgi:hypothetical protein